MDANQFQTFVVAWGTALTTLIAVGVGLGVALRAGLIKVFGLHGQNASAIAEVTRVVAGHDVALNGALDARIKASVDACIAQRRRSADTMPPAP